MTTRTKIIEVPGRTFGLTVPMIAAAPGCAPEIAGLFWFSDDSQAFDAVSEAAYVLPTEPAGPTLAVARLSGETCGRSVDWRTSWTPDSEGAPGAPRIFAADPYLIVYADAETAPGLMTLTASCAGKSVGPIALTVLAAPVGGGACPPSFWKTTNNSGGGFGTFLGYDNPIPDAYVLQTAVGQVTTGSSSLDLSAWMRSPSIEIASWAISASFFSNGTATLTILDDAADSARCRIQISGITSSGSYSNGYVLLVATDMDDVEWPMVFYLLYQTSDPI